ncbi:MAG: ABC transporter permease [Propionicimonas sp.]|nr:ABC transporter permease [Propionicimonas sp.]
MLGALDLGLIFGLMALGVYHTFRVLDFPHLTVDGSYTTGAAVAASLIIAGQAPLLATAVGAAAGGVAGLVTGLLHTKGGINPLLAGILTQIALYSINLRIMGKANLPMLRETTLFSGLRDAQLLGSWVSVLILAVVALAFLILVDWFLNTEIGIALQATGDNERMIRAQGVSTDFTKILGLVISNALVGLAGALIAQYQGFADIGMGIGLIVAGLASVIIGQALVVSRRFVFATLAVVVGSVVYRLIIQLALERGFDPNDMKLISAVLVIAALLLPRLGVFRGWRTRRRERLLAKVAREEEARA